MQRKGMRRNFKKIAKQRQQEGTQIESLRIDWHKNWHYPGNVPASRFRNHGEYIQPLSSSVKFLSHLMSLQSWLNFMPSPKDQPNVVLTVFFEEKNLIAKLKSKGRASTQKPKQRKLTFFSKTFLTLARKARRQFYCRGRNNSIIKALQAFRLCVPRVRNCVSFCVLL
jgi:hypothetical protein